MVLSALGGLSSPVGTARALWERLALFLFELLGAIFKRGEANGLQNPDLNDQANVLEPKKTGL